jgi:hypothetical protein
MRNCPFCGEKIERGFPTFGFNPRSGKWHLEHFCDLFSPEVTVSIAVYGKTEQECIDRWNGVHEEPKSESL